jgi:hypothetical protein
MSATNTEDNATLVARPIMSAIPAAALLNFLTSLTIIAGCIHDDGHDGDDLADAKDSADFWFLGQVGGRSYQPDGRVLIHW